MRKRITRQMTASRIRAPMIWLRENRTETFCSTSILKDAAWLQTLTRYVDERFTRPAEFNYSLKVEHCAGF
jgi:hypothetical protein